MIDVQEAVRALGSGPLSEDSLVQFIYPLFSQVLQRTGNEVYLANHSLGRPLDQTARDVQHALQLWYEKMDDAWEDWLTERDSFRHHVARLINAPSPDCVVPKTSAGQGLRTVLNCYHDKINVVTTRDEFDSVDVILKVYAQQGRINLTRIGPGKDGEYRAADILGAVDESTDLIVVSMVLFTTGQWLTDLPQLIAAAHARDARVLVDIYHAAGVIPLDIQHTDADFAIGGCYKYLRGGPGACWLYLHPRHLGGALQTLDTGWFAQAVPFAFERPASPQFAAGGNAFLESTPTILPFYQARAGLEFVLALGVDRLREYALKQQLRLRELLSERNIKGLGTPAECGAFVAIPHNKAAEVSQELLAKGVRTDAREGLLRMCPDILNTGQELLLAVDCLSEISKKQ